MFHPITMSKQESDSEVIAKNIEKIVHYIENSQDNLSISKSDSEC